MDGQVRFVVGQMKSLEGYVCMYIQSVEVQVRSVDNLAKCLDGYVWSLDGPVWSVAGQVWHRPNPLPARAVYGGGGPLPPCRHYQPPLLRAAMLRWHGTGEAGARSRGIATPAGAVFTTFTHSDRLRKLVPCLCLVCVAMLRRHGKAGAGGTATPAGAIFATFSTSTHSDRFRKLVPCLCLVCVAMPRRHDAGKAGPGG